MFKENHEAAHAAIDAQAEALVEVIDHPLRVRLRLHDLRRSLNQHMKVEERDVVPALDPADASAIMRDHHDLRDRLARLEDHALDVAMGALASSRLEDEIARLFALLEHHDLREKQAYEGCAELAVELPPIGQSLPDDTLDHPEVQCAVARLKWFHERRTEEPAHWQPTLPPSFSGRDEALRAVVLRETELLRTWLSTPPGRERWGAAYRLSASLRATVGFALRRRRPAGDR